MSVINETLENLKQSKQPKKRGTKALNPSSSAYCETTCSAKHHAIAMKPYVISISFAVLMGVFFYISYSYFFASNKTVEVVQKISSVLHAKPSMVAKSSVIPTNKGAYINNPLAQNQYYQAMNLLNAGKEEQALESLRQIIKEYPDFAPAQKAYSMLSVH